MSDCHFLKVRKKEMMKHGQYLAEIFMLELSAVYMHAYVYIVSCHYEDGYSIESSRTRVLFAVH